MTREAALDKIKKGGGLMPLCGHTTCMRWIFPPENKSASYCQCNCKPVLGKGQTILSYIRWRYKRKFFWLYYGIRIKIITWGKCPAVIETLLPGMRYNYSLLYLRYML
jgi:hypothetical protein